MNEFDKLVEELMKCDKKTLAEMLALAQIREKNRITEPTPFIPWQCPPYNPIESIPEYPPFIPTMWCSTNTNEINDFMN